MIQLVIFDMAGTAINEDNLVYKTIQSTLIDFDVELNLPTVLQFAAGKEKRQAIYDVLTEVQNIPPEDGIVDTIHSDFKDNLEAAYNIYDMEVFPSVNMVIMELRKRDIKVAFNTGYNRDTAEKILRKVGLQVGKDIDVLMTASDVKNSRPAPDMITAICEFLNIAPEHAVKIGDSAIDIVEGKNANVKYSIGITTGAQTKSQMEKVDPDFVIDDMLELLPIIEAV